MVSLEDELFLRYVPRLRSLAERISHSKKAVPGWLLGMLVWWMQFVAEHQNRAIRMLTLKQERKQQEMLGFVGRDRQPPKNTACIGLAKNPLTLGRTKCCG